jgi:uncharacterized protein YdbL (DUF1318 family)
MSFLPVWFVLVVACVTINIYFPAAAVEKAADQIVEETWGDEGAAPNKADGEKQSRRNALLRVAGLRLGPGVAYAQEADINVTTPAIRALKESIRQRSGAIKPYMDRGNAGIGRDGLLVVRNTGGLSLKEQASLTRLVQAENRERKSLYREIGKANNFGPERVPDIQEIFARSWMKKARAGWWIQDPGGGWRQR